MPLPQNNPQPDIPIGMQKFASQFPGGTELLQKGLAKRDLVNPSENILDLQRQLQDIIGQGGVGLSPEQLDTQFRGIQQQLQPTFNAQIQQIDEQAARRGVFRSGIPIQKAQETRLKQSQQLGQIRTSIDIQNEKMRSQTLLAALQMLQNLESDISNRQLYLQALEDLKDAQNQEGLQSLLGAGSDFLLNQLFPGAGGNIPGGIPSGSPNAPLPTTGGIT